VPFHPLLQEPTASWHPTETHARHPLHNPEESSSLGASNCPVARFSSCANQLLLLVVSTK
jgi:hypothetical protein